MDEPLILLWTGSASAVAAILLLRFAWALPRRSVPLNASAWGLLLVGVSAGIAAAGAWGAAIVAVMAIGAALLCLTHAAMVSPAGKAVEPNRRAATRRPQDEPLRIGGRLMTFVLTMPVALAASLALGLAVRALGGALGANEANGNVLMLFLVPLAWALLATLVLMWPNRRAQMRLLAAPTLAGLLVLLVTGIAA